MFRRLQQGLVMALALAWSGLAAPASASPRIQVIGDSVMTWNGALAIPAHVAQILGEPVDNNARAGARLRRSTLFVRAVENQYQNGDWDWVIMNGGANDLNRDCGCNRCEAEVDAMVSADGTRGTWPDLVRGVLAEGARRVLIVGYYGPTGLGGRTDRCADELRVVDARLARFAAEREDVFFVDADPVMGPQTPEFFARDNIHPNARGAAAIGALIAAEISRLDPER
ncbi:SGNH/GDSL hydrolase family protein [Dinoroseobacter sp. PD6]|uniref:SGNH/GDSL hydrolase family protein n=1 Tax=Dinoroseobacter sp. PD6 TaxID=3028384 RepID=UPI00237C131D|nr:SGNH/GDSL hydrolase family protein [Dinoroseobacter sp. PD6]MDD9715938.1 SGNH/GDSL hydrolase family protein [Dinoroseobacter sp. PD6]